MPHHDLHNRQKRKNLALVLALVLCMAVFFGVTLLKFANQLAPV